MAMPKAWPAVDVQAMPKAWPVLLTCPAQAGPAFKTTPPEGRPSERSERSRPRAAEPQKER